MQIKNPFFSKRQNSTKISEELYKKNWELNKLLIQTKALTENLEREKSIREEILENIFDIVMMLSEDGKVLTINKAFEREFNQNRDLILNHKFDELIELYLHQEFVTLQQLFENIPWHEKTQTKVSEMVTVKIKDATMRAIIRYTKITGENNSIYWLVTINNKSKDYELEQMKLDFVSMAAHELRTPLTAIRGYASVLSEEIEQGGGEKDSLMESAKRILLSADNLGALVENILSMTKIEKGAIKLKLQNEPWQDCIKEVMSAFEDQIISRKLNVMIEPFDSQESAIVDRLRVNEILSNLISNAIAYTPSGGSITVESQVSDDGKWIETSVSDSGKGIDKNSQKHLFEKFFRVEGPLEEGSKGNGLGLYISKNIVQMHGGKIWVYSEGEGKGTTFTYQVPRA